MYIYIYIIYPASKYILHEGLPQVAKLSTGQWCHGAFTLDYGAPGHPTIPWDAATWFLCSIIHNPYEGGRSNMSMA